MEKSQKISVTVPEGYDSTKPIIIHLLEGEAPKPVKTLHPQKVSVTGDITAPLRYARDRYKSIEIEPVSQGSSIPDENKKAIVTYMDKAAGPWIKLETDPSSEIGVTIKGELKKNPDLAPFHFNESAVFDNKAFIAVLRKSAHCFTNTQEVVAMIKQLQNMVAKFETEVENLDDKQGNTTNSVRTALNASKAGIPTELHFNMPLFSGGPRVPFSASVEIDVEFTGGKSPKAMFGLFSLDLDVNLTETAIKITHGEINELSKYFTCIRVES